jgi:hypothetical protein
MGWTTYTEDDGLAEDYVSSIVAAPDGALWLITGAGVSCFDGQTWTTYTEDDGLAGDYVRSVASAPDGSMWFVTGGGVSRFDGECGLDKAWTTYTSRISGLPSGYVDAPVFDRQGRAWFVAGGRLAALDLSTGRPGRIPQAAGDAWATARIVGLLAAISLPFVWLARRVAARGLMSLPLAIGMLAIGTAGALACPLTMPILFPHAWDRPAAVPCLVVAVGLAVCGGLGLRRRSAAKEPERLRESSSPPLPSATVVGEAHPESAETEAEVDGMAAHLPLDEV